MEKQTQTRLVKFLKHNGCYVIKTHPGLGTPTGCPDILFFKEGFWGAVECKASRTAKWQPLQKETLAKLAKWSWAKVVYPENLESIMDELKNLL